VSKRDFLRFEEALNWLAGKTFEVGLATNSIKLLFDPENHRHRYVWVDPPWVLKRRESEIASGADYPDPAEAEHQAKHETWCARVKALLDGRVLKDARSWPDGTVDMRLSGRLTLVLLAHDDRADDSERWYDDWYVKLEDALQGVEADEAWPDWSFAA